MMGEQTTTCFFRNHLAPVAQAIAVDHFFLLEIMNVGEIFVARQEFSTHCLGYLEVSVGDRILLLHVGDDWKSKEKDWVYGENVKSRQRGWLPKICHVRVAATATAGEIFVARQKFVKVPHCVGYLEVSVGDKILLLHVGDDASSEEKDWIYGEAVQSGQRGWLPKSCYGQVVDDPGKPPHQCSLFELQVLLENKKVPQIDKMDRSLLEEALRTVRQWEKQDFVQLENHAKAFFGKKWSTRPDCTREELIDDMIQYRWGDKSQAAPTQKEPRGTPPASAITTPSSARSTASSPRRDHCPDERFAREVLRINTAIDYRGMLGFASGETISAELAKKKYRHLLLLLHPDKRTDSGILSAGGDQVCRSAWDRLTAAYAWAEKVTKGGVSVSARKAASQPPTTRSSSPQSCYGQSTRPRPPPGPPPKARQRTPPGRKSETSFGGGPIGPPPRPHPNFGALRIVVVD